MHLIKKSFFYLITVDLDEDENESEQKRCDEKGREVDTGFYLLKEMLVTVHLSLLVSGKKLTK